eukprot:gene8589-34031_t
MPKDYIGVQNGKWGAKAVMKAYGGNQLYTVVGVYDTILEAASVRDFCVMGMGMAASPKLNFKPSCHLMSVAMNTVMDTLRQQSQHFK